MKPVIKGNIKILNESHIDIYDNATNDCESEVEVQSIHKIYRNQRHTVLLNDDLSLSKIEICNTSHHSSSPCDTVKETNVVDIENSLCREEVLIDSNTDMEIDYNIEEGTSGQNKLKENSYTKFVEDDINLAEETTNEEIQMDTEVDKIEKNKLLTDVVECDTNGKSCRENTKCYQQGELDIVAEGVTNKYKERKTIPYNTINMDLGVDRENEKVINNAIEIQSLIPALSNYRKTETKLFGTSGNIDLGTDLRSSPREYPTNKCVLYYEYDAFGKSDRLVSSRKTIYNDANMDLEADDNIKDISVGESKNNLDPAKVYINPKKDFHKKIDIVDDHSKLVHFIMEEQCGFDSSIIKECSLGNDGNDNCENDQIFIGTHCEEDGKDLKSNLKNCTVLRPERSLYFNQDIECTLENSEDSSNCETEQRDGKVYVGSGGYLEKIAELCPATQPRKTLYFYQHIEMNGKDEVIKTSGHMVKKRQTIVEHNDMDLDDCIQYSHNDELKTDSDFNPGETRYFNDEALEMDLCESINGNNQNYAENEKNIKIKKENDFCCNKRKLSKLIYTKSQDNDHNYPLESKIIIDDNPSINNSKWRCNDNNEPCVDTGRELLYEATPHRSLNEFLETEEYVNAEDNMYKSPKQNDRSIKRLPRHLTPILSMAKKRHTLVFSNSVVDESILFDGHNEIELSGNKSEINRDRHAKKSATFSNNNANENSTKQLSPANTGSSLDTCNILRSESISEDVESTAQSIQEIRRATLVHINEHITGPEKQHTPLELKSAISEDHVINISDVSAYFQTERKGPTTSYAARDRSFQRCYMNITCDSTMENIDKTRLSLVKTISDDDDGYDVDVIQSKLSESRLTPQLTEIVTEANTQLNPCPLSSCNENQIQNVPSVCRKCKQCQETFFYDSIYSTIDSFILPVLPPVPPLNLDRLRRLRNRPHISDVNVLWQRVSLDRTMTNLNNKYENNSTLFSNIRKIVSPNSSIAIESINKLSNATKGYAYIIISCDLFLKTFCTQN